MNTKSTNEKDSDLRQNEECGCHEHMHRCGCHEHHHEHHNEHGCGCHEHHHEHHGHGSWGVVRIILAAVLLLVAWLIQRQFGFAVWQALLLYLVPYLIVSYDVIGEALEGIVRLEPFNEHLLMTIATAGAFAIGFLPGAEPQFAEGVFVMLFFQVGELFEHYAEDNSRKSIKHLLDLKPKTAQVERDGKTVEVETNDIRVGETVVLRVGDRVPLDGIVIEGESNLNTMALTGESKPQQVEKGSEILSGTVNMTAVIRMQVKKTAEDSTVQKIIDLVENASEKKSRSESFIHRFAKIYTPIVTISALLLAFVPPLFYISYSEALTVWLYRALTFLVVSCPCALVISVPLSFFGGIGGASKKGILIKGASYMDMLADLDAVVFDKTGTLTEGQFAVTAVHPEEIDEKELLHLAAHVERYSTHPIAVALKNAYPEEQDDCQISEVREVAGHGIIAKVNQKEVAVGNKKLIQTLNVEWHDCHLSGTIAHVAINGRYAGHIVISDKIKADAKTAITELKKAGIQTVMFTGDNNEVAGAVAGELGVDDYKSELLPQDKVIELETLAYSAKRLKTVAFVGDGLNDAPVLMRAHVGIAMGGLGSEAAIEAADVVIMDDRPSKVTLAIKISKRTIGIARQNVVFAIVIKTLVLFFAAIGVATMWMAVFADVGVMVLAVLNSMRTLRN